MTKKIIIFTLSLTPFLLSSCKNKADKQTNKKEEIKDKDINETKTCIMSD